MFCQVCQVAAPVEKFAVSDCIFSCCNLPFMFDSERDEDRAQVPGVASAESSCAATKAVEVCVNGVKQVIIIPLAQPSDDVTTTTSGGFDPPCFSSLSSKAESMPLDRVPDDVRLLAESCIRVSSSLSVSDFDTFGIPSLATSSQTCAPTRYLRPPPPYPMFDVSHMPTASLPADIPGNTYNAALPVICANSNDNTATVPSFVPYPSPSFPTVPGLSTSVCGFPPALQSECPVPLPTPLQKQPFSFPRVRNPVLPGKIQPPNLNSMISIPSTVSRVPWMSHSSLQVRPTYGGNNMAMDRAVNSYLPSGPTVVPSWSPFDPLLSNYHHFLPSLQCAITPNSSVNQPSSPVFAGYFSRKRGGLSQNSAQGLQVNAGSDLMRHNFRMLQFYPQYVTSQRPPPLVNANEMQMRRVRANQRPSPQANANEVRVQRGRTNQRPSRPVKNANEVQARHSVTNQMPYPPANANEVQMRHGLASQGPPLVRTSEVQIRQQKPRLSFLNSYRSWTEKRNDLTNEEKRNGEEAEKDSFHLSDKTVYSESGEKVSVESDVGGKPSQLLAVSSIPTDLQVMASHTTSVLVCTSSPLAAMTACVSQTVSRTTAVTQASVTTECNSMGNLTADSLRFDVSSDVTARNVLNKYSLSCRGLSNLSSTDLFLPTADHADDSSQTVTGSGTLQHSHASLDNGASQLDDAFGDLNSLPADVMDETAESLSLLASFCNMFDRSDSPCQPSAPVSCPATSSGVKNHLENGQQTDKGNDAGIRGEYAERCLQFAKSLGKGRHFAEEMRQQRQQQAKKRRRRTRLTSLEFADESNSSDSWHPDTQSESSNYHTPSPSPVPSTASSRSRSSNDFVVVSRRTRNQRVTRQKRKRSSFHSRSRPHVITKKCSVMLEQLHMQGQLSVNVHLVDRLICCPQYDVVKPVQRIVSSDSEASAADTRPILKVRLRVPSVADTDSS